MSEKVVRRRVSLTEGRLVIHTTIVETGENRVARADEPSLVETQPAAQVRHSRRIGRKAKPDSTKRS